MGSASVVVFDMGGVLYDFQGDRLIARSSRRARRWRSEEVQALWPQLVRGFETGVSSEADFAETVIERYALSLQPLEFLADQPLRNPEAQVCAGDRHVARGDHLLEQVQQVEAADVVRVALPGAAKRVEPGGLVAKPEKQFYGDRSGGVKEPCGNTIWIATHVEDVAPDELKRRAAQAMAKTS